MFVGFWKVDQFPYERLPSSARWRVGVVVLVEVVGAPGSWNWPRRSSPEVVIEREVDLLTALTDQIVVGGEILL